MTEFQKSVLEIMPTKIIKNKHLKETFLFVSSKVKTWQRLKTKTRILEQHSRLIEIKMIENVLFSYCAIEEVPLIKSFICYLISDSQGY